MKQCFLIPLFMVLLSTASAQNKKQAAKDKPPTQKEMDAMMNEMQQELDGMSEEDKKAMEAMGIKMPDTKEMKKNMAGVTDAQLKKAYEDDNRIVPLKDVARINAALGTTLTTGGITAYINKTHEAILLQLSPAAKSKGAEIIAALNKQNASLGNAAVGLWIDGKATLALYLMGAACKADPSDANNLNNYASFLTMCGAEQVAIPILNNLNSRFPKNSTILNNIAQAWLGLGDVARAEKYTDSALRIYAMHPQANMAKCLIEESKGNIPAAIAAAKKGISKGYSLEKDNKLQKLGYTLKSDDLDWDRPMPADPLGLSKFTWPAYPLDVDQTQRLEKEWAQFKENCQEKINELKIRQARLEKEMEEANLRRTKELLTESQKGNYVQAVPGYALKAIKKLGYLVSDIDGNRSFVFVRELEPLVKLYKESAEHEDVLSKNQQELDKKYEDQVGEGRSNPLEEICKEENEIRNEFLKNTNGKMEAAYRQYLEYVRKKTADLLYYLQYTSWPEQFEFMKVNAQIAWLTQIKDQKVQFKPKSSWCKKTTFREKQDSLQNFDDVACQYVSETNLGVYKITSSCSNLTGEFNFGGVKINLKDNVETGRYSGSAIVGISKGFGPKCFSAKGSVAGTVEWDNSGITDAGAIVGVAVKTGPVTLGGAEIKATVNTGISKSGKFLGQKF